RTSAMDGGDIRRPQDWIANKSKTTAAKATASQTRWGLSFHMAAGYLGMLLSLSLLRLGDCLIASLRFGWTDGDGDWVDQQTDGPISCSHHNRKLTDYWEGNPVRAGRGVGYDRVFGKYSLRITMQTATNGKVLLRVRPRGFCAGVVRAVDIVELALEAYGAPVYVHHEIVHNTYVVEQ